MAGLWDLKSLFLEFCFSTLWSMMVPYSSHLVRGHFCLHPIGQNSAVWQLSIVRKAGKYSLYLGSHVPRVPFLKTKGIMLNNNWQSSTITCHMGITVWCIFPQQEAADHHPLHYLSSVGGRGWPSVQRVGTLAKAQGTTCSGPFRESAHYNLSKWLILNYWSRHDWKISLVSEN